MPTLLAPEVSPDKAARLRKHGQQSHRWLRQVSAGDAGHVVKQLWPGQPHTQGQEDTMVSLYKDP